MNRQTIMKFCAAPLAGLLFASCAQVKEYQKSRINDSEMILTNRKVEKNERIECSILPGRIIRSQRWQNRRRLRLQLIVNKN